MPEARPVIPPAWAKHARCPVCAGGLLEVRQHLPAPDQLACLRCDTAFEVELHGSRVRLTTAPPRYQAVLGQWLTFAEVAQAKNAAGPGSAPPTAPPPEPHVTALAHARDLLRLGNAPQDIERILHGWETLTPAQRAEINTLIQAEAQRAQHKQARWGWVLGALALVAVMVVSAVGVWYAWQRPAGPGPTPNNSHLAAPVSQPPTAVLPPALQTLVPPGMTILQPATPAIQRGAGPPASACPATPAQAADLFGGPASAWQKDPNSGGWMLLAMTPVTVRVPAGMTLAYMTFAGSGGLESVTGPAIVDNLNFAAVTCD